MELAASRSCSAASICKQSTTASASSSSRVHRVLLALCTVALVVCITSWEQAVTQRGGSSSTSLAGASEAFSDAASDGIAGGIIDSARRKFEAEKRLQAKFRQGAKHVNKPKPSPEEQHSVNDLVSGKHGAETLEEKIAAHKLSTRDLVKAVQEKQEAEEQQMGQGLKDQTDDLIVQRIKELKGKQDTGGASSSDSTTKYVLSNALTKVERQQLQHSHTAAPRAAETADTNNGAGEEDQSKVAARAPPNMSQLRETPPGEATKTGGGGDTSGMLSNYDQQLLKSGPEGVETSAGGGGGGGGGGGEPQTQAVAPPEPQEPAPQYATQYGGYAGYQQGGYASAPPAYGGEYPQAPQYGPPAYAVAPPSYAPSYPPMAQGFAQQPQQPPYSPPQLQPRPQGGYASAPYQPQPSLYQQSGPYSGPYALPPGVQGAMATEQVQGMQPSFPTQAGMANSYQGPVLAQPAYQQPQYQQPQYLQYPLYARPAEYQAPYQQMPAQYAPQPALEQPVQPQYAEQPAAPRQATAAGASNAGVQTEGDKQAENEGDPENGGGAGSTGSLSSSGGGGGQGQLGSLSGDKLWQMFIAPSSSYGAGGSTSAGGGAEQSPGGGGGGALSGGGGGGGGRGGSSASGGGVQGGDNVRLGTEGMGGLSSTVQSSRGGMGGGMGGGGLDPRKLLPSGVGTGSASALRLSPQAKMSIRAKMNALQQSIMQDFKATTDMGNRAGYLPPPPMP